MLNPYFCQVNGVKIARRAYAYLVLAVFIITFLLLYPFFLFTLSNEKRYRYANHLRRIWAHSLFIGTGIGNDIQFQTALDPNQQYIICPNHSSVIDIPLAALCLKGFNFRFMAKDEFQRIPLFNIFFRTVDISIKRQSKVDSFRAYQQAAASIDKGYSLIIFPEGTTSKQAPQMLNFKRGAFKLAIEKQIPIVPVTFMDNWWVFPYNGTMLCTNGTARALVHEPIDTKGMTEEDVDRLKYTVYNTIDSSLKKEYASRYAFSR